MVDKRATFFPVCGARAQFGPRPPVLTFVDHTQLDTHTHTSSGSPPNDDKLVAEAATYTTNTR